MNIKQDFFENVKEIATFRKNYEVLNPKELTGEELDYIEICIEDLKKKITSAAQKGNFQLDYDCSSMDLAIFNELSKRFKYRYTKFMVIKDFGQKMLSIRWTGKNEV